MTHPEKLNAILHILLNNQRAILEKKPIDKRMTFEFICKTVAEVTDKWEVEYLRNILLNDEYIKMGEFGDGEPPVITHTGIKFIQAGGYKKEAENRELESEIKRHTIKSLKRSRTSLLVSICAIIISATIGIFSLLKSKPEVTSEQMQVLKSQMETSTNQLSQQRIILDSLVKKLSDTSNVPRR